MGEIMESTPQPEAKTNNGTSLQPDLTDPLQRFLMELLEHYTLPGEAEEAFAGWWKDMQEALRATK